jgi:hypothetical protein
MTGYTVHTGSNEKFSSGWDNIFGGGKKPASQTKNTAAQPAESEKKASKSGKSGKKR